MPPNDGAPPLPTSRDVDVGHEPDDGSATVGLSSQAVLTPASHHSAQESSDAGAIDASVISDAARSDASCHAESCECDNDGDGFFDLMKLGCEDSGGPNDCDDTDSRVHPNQSYLDVSSPPRGGDWNCANGVEKLYPSQVSCGLLALGACAGVQGFKTDPGCGEDGDYVFCQVALGLFCAPGATTTRKQACK